VSQRQANTVGLVLERDRSEEEKDGLIWWVGDTKEVLYEAYFHCTDLGVQLKPIIEKFRASDAFKTGVPNKEDGKSWVTMHTLCAHTNNSIDIYRYSVDY